MTDYLIRQRDLCESFEVGEMDVRAKLHAEWGLDVESPEDRVVLTISANNGTYVKLEAGDVAEILHPLVTALRFLLHNVTVNEDELEDMWGSRS